MRWTQEAGSAESGRPGRRPRAAAAPEGPALLGRGLEVRGQEIPMVVTTAAVASTMVEATAATAAAAATIRRGTGCQLCCGECPYQTPALTSPATLGGTRAALAWAVAPRGQSRTRTCRILRRTKQRGLQVERAAEREGCGKQTTGSAKTPATGTGTGCTGAYTSSRRTAAGAADLQAGHRRPASPQCWLLWGVPPAVSYADPRRRPDR
mmetsp:Transcript_32386/g.81493  ORF Transcript_32386/g.81493 Transcript_32386/m.81493 type:complete len:209 (+) Transcript_32386:460-1086(+)